MLVKRTQHPARRRALGAAPAHDQSARDLDRRSFLRHSSLAAGSLATLGALQLARI